MKNSYHESDVRVAALRAAARRGGKAVAELGLSQTELANLGMDASEVRLHGRAITLDDDGGGAMAAAAAAVAEGGGGLVSIAEADAEAENHRERDRAIYAMQLAEATQNERDLIDAQGAGDADGAGSMLTQHGADGGADGAGGAGGAGEATLAVTVNATPEGTEGTHGGALDAAPPHTVDPQDHPLAKALAQSSRRPSSNSTPDMRSLTGAAAHMTMDDMEDEALLIFRKMSGERYVCVCVWCSRGAIGYRL